MSVAVGARWKALLLLGFLNSPSRQRTGTWLTPRPAVIEVMVRAFHNRWGCASRALTAQIFEGPQRDRRTEMERHVVVIGAGYAGVMAALRAALDTG
ncbi:MAG: hypothetical protein K2X56_02045 [Mycobacterium pseudokansasii]|uniref:hypothetical protein n=1 Tax=Mycobacterium pseudokansasii TaxID=2341080 RepID=UPI0023F49939|nr:hypothetical protein [Mycobacterium pseudokansasii]MBY0386910.1 hypothetical protein [Mycobacterium pseudokansasii]